LFYDALRDSRILVVDDEQSNVVLLGELLRRWGLTDVVGTTNSSEVVELCSVAEPDLILLDLHMPPPDGFEVLAQLAPWIHSATPVPVLMLTADTTPEVKRRALAHGARDFVTKPFDFEEVRLRIVNLLEMRRLQSELHHHRELLEQRIRERTSDLQEARTDILERLARAVEYRDDATGEHTRRVGRTAGMTANALGLGAAAADQIELAAPLHDVGKIAIPDNILLKPGRLSEREFDQMKQHASIGAELLSGSRSPVLETAREIAFTHHERWDGAGYPRGITGQQIPIAGRIVAVADVFDALTHERPYKRASSAEDALETVLGGAGEVFDPEVVEAFAVLDHDLLLGPIDNPHQPVQPARSPQRETSESDRETRFANGDASAVTLRKAANAVSVSQITLRDGIQLAAPS
jgi:putative two-component system response regulator